MKTAPLSVLDQNLKKALALCAKSPLSPSEFEKANRSARTAAEALADHGLEGPVRSLSTYFLSSGRQRELGQQAAYPVKEFVACGDKGLERTVEFGIQKGLAHFADLPAEDLLRSVNTSSLLSKLQQRRPTLLREALEHLRCSLASGNNVSTSALWAVQKAKITDLVPLIPRLLIASERKLCGIALGRDTSGKLLVPVLNVVNAGHVSCLQVAGILADHPQAAQNFLKNLPFTLAKGASDKALEILRALLDGIHRVPEGQRGGVSGAMAYFCGVLLSKARRKTADVAALEMIGGKLREIASGDISEFNGFWALFPLDKASGKSRQGFQVSRDAAMLVVEAEDKVHDPRYSAVEVFKALAINLGIEPFLTEGDSVLFDFTVHQDVGGGLIVGSSAIVVNPGWRHDNVIIRKAPVRPLHIP